MNDVSDYSFLTYKFSDLSLRRLAFIAAGADERVHDGNRFLASTGQPLISLFAAEILKARNVQLSNTIRIMHFSAPAKHKQANYTAPSDY